MPAEADDSLSSVEYAQILDFISEGEIDGIENGLEGVYFNKTPVRNADGSDNFRGFDFVERTGTQAQTYISQSTGTEQTFNSGVKITNAGSPGPAIFSITNSEIDKVRVTITIPSLLVQQENGDVEATNVEIMIERQYAGGAYAQVFKQNIKGKTTDPYQRDYLVPTDGAFPVNIRVTRMTADDPLSGFPKKQSQVYLANYTTIIEEKFRYPNSALAWTRFDAREFSSVPQRRFLVRGIKIRVPSNATVDETTYLGRITYSGVWDGTWATNRVWTSDPAWCLFDLLSNTRYGCNLPESSLSKWDFYTISQYCNELVSDGKGGQEARFALNLHIKETQNIFDAIKNLTAIFRGINYYASGSMVILQDKPVNVSNYLLGPSNVVGGTFLYEGTSVRTRHTTALVAYQTYEDLGEVRFEYVEDRDGIAKYGVVNKDIRSVGCYSQGQAHRIGKWMLLSEQNLSETVSFSIAPSEGLILRPGMVVDIADPLKGNTRRQGRIKSSTTTRVMLDSGTDLSIDMNNSPTISVVLPTGLVETKDIDASSSNVANGDIAIIGAFSVAPKKDGTWLIQTTDIQSQQFRILSVKEEDGGILAATAVIYNSSIYDAIEKDLNLTQRDTTNLTDPPDVVTNLSASEYLYQSGSSVLVGVNLSWTSPVKRVHEFTGRYRVDSDNWESFTVKSPNLTLKDVKAGTLQVEVQTVNFVNGTSQVVAGSFVIAGKTAPPSNVSNLTFEPISNNSGRLRWDKATDLDVIVGGAVQIRHSNLTDGSATWANSVSLIAAKTGVQTEAIVPLIEGEILVKFEDSSGFVSISAASVIVDLPDTIQPLTILSQREDQISPTPFSGAKTNVTYDASAGGLVLTTEAFDGVASVDAITDWDAVGYGDVATTGTYLFAGQLDLGAVYSLDLIRHFATVGYLPDDDLDARAANVDTWGDWDGEVNNVDAKLYVRKTNDNPGSGSPTWSGWQEFTNGTFKLRGAEFKAVLSSSDTDENIKVTQLGFGASLKRRQEQSVGVVASGAGSKTITFSDPFFTGTSSLGGSTSAFLPSVGIIVQNLSTGDYIDGPTVTATNFTFTIKNSSGAAINKNFTWSAVGYGLGT